MVVFIITTEIIPWFIQVKSVSTYSCTISKYLLRPRLRGIRISHDAMIHMHVSQLLLNDCQSEKSFLSWGDKKTEKKYFEKRGCPLLRSISWDNFSAIANIIFLNRGQTYLPPWKGGSKKAERHHLTVFCPARFTSKVRIAHQNFTKNTLNKVPEPLGIMLLLYSIQQRTIIIT